MSLILCLLFKLVPFKMNLSSHTGTNNHAMIRVLSLEFNERSLLKGFTGAVTDLAFAHLDSSLLGCVDEAGNLMVWQLTCTGGKILYPDMLEKQKGV